MYTLRYKVSVHEYDYNTESYNVVFENGDKGKVHQSSLTKLERSINADEDDYSRLIENKYVNQEYILATVITRHQQLHLIKPDVKSNDVYLQLCSCSLVFNCFASNSTAKNSD
jgi:hypothetical protein